MFGTAALLFGWTLLEELPKNPPPPKEKETFTSTSTSGFDSSGIFRGGPGSLALGAPPPQPIDYGPPGSLALGAAPRRQPPPNQFDIVRQIAGPRIYQH